MRREVEDALLIGLGRFWVAQEFRHILWLDLGRVGAAGVEEGAARAVDGAHPVLVELCVAFIVGRRVDGVQVQQPAPPAPDADDFVAFIDRAIDRRLDARVQAGDIAAAGQNTNSHVLLLFY